MSESAGAYIRTRRTSQGLTAAAVVKSVEAITGKKWHQTTLTRIETGQQGISLAQAVVLSHVLGFSLDEMVDSLGLDPSAAIRTARLREIETAIASLQDEAKRLEAQR